MGVQGVGGTKTGLFLIHIQGCGTKNHARWHSAWVAANRAPSILENRGTEENKKREGEKLGKTGKKKEKLGSCYLRLFYRGVCETPPSEPFIGRFCERKRESLESRSKYAGSRFFFATAGAQSH